MYQIFISLRFAEAGKEAEALKSALEARGISAFLCAVHPGGDICREVVNALHGCQLAIIMGTRTYGKDTGAGFSTFEELRFIHGQKKPFFLIKMCERFEEPETTFRLDSSVSYFQWFSGRPMPNDLVPKILEKLTSIGGISSSVLPVASDFKKPTKERKVYDNGDVYEGELEDGKKHGKGKFVWTCGDVYEGDWKDNNRHGNGKMLSPNGEVYEGDWKDDKMHGHGKYVGADGDVYEGDFKDHNPHKGKLVYTDGDVYEGDFKGAMKHGKGKMVYTNGRVYEGDWKDDKRNGKGRYEWDSRSKYVGHVYDGEWKDDTRNGKGKMMYADGDVYEGDWKNDKQNGKGKMVYCDGSGFVRPQDTYEGSWKDNKRHGKGKMVYADGRVYDGNWKDGEERKGFFW
jgi:hypothetical protein